MATVITQEEAKANIAANLTSLIDGVVHTQSTIARAIMEDGEEVQNARMRVHRYVKGQSLPDAVALARLAESLGVTTDFLLSAPVKKKYRKDRKAS